MLESWGGPTVTNDGVTIAREIDLDPFENLGAQLVKSVATKTNDVAGDGTTTATVLAQAIIEGGSAQHRRRGEPDGTRCGYRQGGRCGVGGAARRGLPVDGKTAIAQVATVSSRDEEIGEMVGEAATKVGTDGVVTVEESST